MSQQAVLRVLNPGEIAIIDHADLDRIGAEELIRRKAAAVVNASVSITGRYPNLGPQLLLEAGIPVIDAVGPDALVWVDDGMVVRLDDQTLYSDRISLPPDFHRGGLPRAGHRDHDRLHEGVPLSRRRPARR